MSGVAINKQTRAEGLLLVAALLWGIAFVPQKIAMDHIEPLAFNAWRFLLGGLLLIPVVYWMSGRREGQGSRDVIYSWRACLPGGAVLGVWLFLGAALQQAGLLYTTAGRAGFITGFYLLLVPLMGLALGHRTNRGTWMGIAMAMVGLYLLSDLESEAQLVGDMMVFASAFVFAAQVLTADFLVDRFDALRLSAIQFLVCGLLSAIASAFLEDAKLAHAAAAFWPIVYLVIFSTAIGFTFQLLGQRDAHPSHATVILSLESVFALAAGWLFLNEYLNWVELAGCGLMAAGMLISHFGNDHAVAEPAHGGVVPGEAE
ncbi:DMT family transporter [Biformimicrobium ophioploci]|uniref:DMT family transporter n=1 Tax=Biformimicrobium ophioploci TaxID=3036711 RepID=A0ABQ6LZR4_9GAMM|nr:DMT family transporter [Microbulbifer sp. NKW57]GMG87532.1 DMT family transporter [Microbulbifer sp. NKW57]